MHGQRCLRILLTASLLLTLAISAHAAIIYVNWAQTGPADGTTWAKAFPTVRQAVTSAIGANEIWVARGTYVVGSQPLKVGLALYGGFLGTETLRTQRNPAVNVTILDGNYEGPVIIIPLAATNATTVDGFTITNGTGTPNPNSSGGGIYCLNASATINDNIIYGNSATYGGAIYCENAASMVITDNVIYYNSAYTGGGIYCLTSASTSAPVITDNTISYNNAALNGGGIYCDGTHGGAPGITTTPVITDNMIYHNNAGVDGGGIYGSHMTAPVITDNTISENTAITGAAGGVYLHGDTTGSVQRNWIADNIAGTTGGGLYTVTSVDTIASNLFAGNSAANGGGVYTNAGATGPLVINNTIYANTASAQGGGIYCLATDVGGTKLENNIVALNSSGIWGTATADFIVLNNNDVYGNIGAAYTGVVAGPNSSVADPLFVAPLTSDFRLQATSPCKDTGLITNVGLTWTDLDGNPRIFPVGSGLVDMGALEYIYVETPTFTPDGSTTYASAQSVTIATTTTGATIRYTTDNTAVTVTSPLYSAPVLIATTTILRAKAYKTGWGDSPELTATFTIQICATPTFLPVAGTYAGAQTVTISCTSPTGAHFHYTTDGTEPTGSSTEGSSVAVGESLTLKAKAYKTDWGDSATGTAVYTIQVCVTPTLSPAGGSYAAPQTVTISTATAGASIYYTTDGTAPDATKTLYSAPIIISVTTVVNAIAIKASYVNSGIVTGTYVITITKVGTPTFSPVAGTYPIAQSVTISTATAGADIYYTTDGGTPDGTSTLYTGAITISVATTVKAIGIKTGLTNSDVGEAAYTLGGTVATPTFSPVAGTYPSPQTVAITCASPTGASIYYTTNGADPTGLSTLYTGGITISVTTTVKAKAYKTGFLASAVGSALYTLTGAIVATPTFDPAAGTYSSAQFVTLTCATSGASIYYTTDGTDPTIGSTLYGGTPISVAVTTTLKAIGIKAGSTNSAIATAVYTIICATPTFSPVAGTYTSAQSVTISCATSGADIYYTTDGTDPSGLSTVYTGAITISVTTTVKAIGIKTGLANSAIATAAYVISGGDYPVNVSLAPTTGTLGIETKLTFTAVYSDSHGYSTLRSCYLLINPTSSCLKAAYVRYDPVTNKLYMRNDGNTTWMGGFAPGANGTVANGYARIYCNETTVVKSGNTITVTWKIALKSPYTLRPTCTGYMFCYNAAGNYAGWDAKGTYSVH